MSTSKNCAKVPKYFYDSTDVVLWNNEDHRRIWLMQVEIAGAPKDPFSKLRVRVGNTYRLSGRDYPVLIMAIYHYSTSSKYIFCGAEQLKDVEKSKKDCVVGKKIIEAPLHQIIADAPDPSDEWWELACEQMENEWKVYGYRLLVESDPDDEKSWRDTRLDFAAAMGVPESTREFLLDPPIIIKSSKDSFMDSGSELYEEEIYLSTPKYSKSKRVKKEIASPPFITSSHDSINSTPINNNNNNNHNYNNNNNLSYQEVNKINELQMQLSEAQEQIVVFREKCAKLEGMLTSKDDVIQILTLQSADYKKMLFKYQDRGA